MTEERKLYLQNYRQAHREHIKELQKDWYQRNKEEIRIKRCYKTKTAAFMRGQDYEMHK